MSNLRTYTVAPTPTAGLIQNPVAGCTNWHVSRWCPSRNYIKNPSFEYDTAGWAARTPGGGNFIQRTYLSVYSGAYACWAASSGAAFPGIKYDLGYLVAGNQGKTFTLSVAVNPNAAQILTLNVIAAAGSDRLLGTVTRDIVCGWERLEVVFAIPNTSDYGTAVTGLYFEITTLVNGPFYVDSAMIVEGAKPNILYFDGDERGRWTGSPGASYSDADESEPNGEMVDLRALGFDITGFAGLGLPASEHIGTDSALRGGKTYDRTLQRAAAFTLTGRVYDRPGRDGDTLQTIRARLIEILKPQNADARARDVMIEYQPCDCEGVMCCKRRIRAKLTEDGLAGNLDSPGGETLTLKFEVGAPPAVTEEAGNAQSLVASQTITVQGFIGYTKETGWINPIAVGASSVSQVLGLAIIDAGVWAAGSFSGSGVRFTGVDGVMFEPSGLLPNSVATAIAVAPNTDAWISGSTNFLYRYDITGTSTNMGAAFNGYANKILFHPNGNVYVFGTFTTPGPRMVVSADYGTTWVTAAVTGVNGPVEDATILPDGRIVIVGNFTQAGGVACVNAAIYTPNTNTFQPLTTSADGRILAVTVGLDGRVYLGGEFATLNGIACSRIAVWNGTQVQSMGKGIYNANTAALPSVITIATNPNGEIWVGGTFNRSGDLDVYCLAIWNGSTWVSPDVAFDSGSGVGYCSGFTKSGAYISGLANSYNTGATTSGMQGVCYNGSADERPVLIFTGPGRIRNLRNITTGATIYLNYQMQRGEVCTLDLTRDAKAIFTSSYYGNKPGAILRGSDLDRFALKAPSRSQTCKTCPNNTISAFISGGVPGITTAVLTYESRHWGVDADCGAPIKRRETNTGGIPFGNFKTISGVLTTCNGNLSGQLITVYDDQGNFTTVTTTAGGAFSVTLPFIASDTFVTAVFNANSASEWGGQPAYATLRVLKSDPPLLNFPAFFPQPCCALKLRLILNAGAVPITATGNVAVTISSSGGGTPITINQPLDAPGVMVIYVPNPTIQPGTLTVQVSPVGYSTQTGTVVFSICNRMDLTLNSFVVGGTTVQGTLTDCNGNPINGATIIITHNDGLNAARTVTTNSQGKFTDTFAYAPGLLIATGAAFPGYTARGPVEVRNLLATPGGVFTFAPFPSPLPCPNLVTLNGTLVDCYNVALAGKTVSILDSANAVRTAVTDGSGNFTITDSFPIGTIRVSFHDAAYTTGTSIAQVNYTGGNSTLTLPAFTPLPCCPIIASGTVNDVNNAPVYGAQVIITDSVGNSFYTFTSLAGTWSIAAAFAPGPFTAIAAATGYSNTASTTGSFTYCQPKTVFLSGILQPLTSSVLGQLTDCHGNDVAFATVTITDSAGRHYTATTNGTGNFISSHPFSLGLITASATSPSYGNTSIGTGNLNAYGANVNISNWSPLLC